MRLRKGTTQPGSYVSNTRRCMRESTLVNAGECQGKETYERWVMLIGSRRVQEERAGCTRRA